MRKSPHFLQDVSVTSAKKYQYKGFNSSGSTVGIMLNTDVEIFYNLTLDSNAKATCTLDATCGIDSSCSSSECAKATTFDLAYSYGQVNCGELAVTFNFD